MPVTELEAKSLHVKAVLIHEDASVMSEMSDKIDITGRVNRVLNKVSMEIVKEVV